MGSGGNSKVWVAKDLNNKGFKVAIKIMKIKYFTNQYIEGIKKEVEDEVNLMQQV